MTERSGSHDPPVDEPSGHLIEITVDPELAADPTVRAALEHLSQQLAEAELLDDDEVSGFATEDLTRISLDRSGTLAPTSTNAGCFGFFFPKEGPVSCGVHWTSCITDGWF